MKMFVVVALALVAAVAAAPVEQEPAKIIRSEFNQEPNGEYEFSFETENGIVQQEKGTLKEVTDEEGKPQLVLVKSGLFQYPNADGTIEEITYVADESGSHPEGSSIPVAPVARR